MTPGGNCVISRHSQYVHHTHITAYRLFITHQYISTYHSKKNVTQNKFDAIIMYYFVLCKYSNGLQRKKQAVQPLKRHISIMFAEGICF